MDATDASNPPEVCYHGNQCLITSVDKHMNCFCDSGVMQWSGYLENMELT